MIATALNSEARRRKIAGVVARHEQAAGWLEGASGMLLTGAWCSRSNQFDGEASAVANWIGGGGGGELW